MNTDSETIAAELGTGPFRQELAFPFATDVMMECLRSYGDLLEAPTGTALFTHGDREVDMFVVLSGSVSIYAAEEGGDRKVVAVARPRQFTGELDLISSQPTLVDACVTSDATLLRIKRADLQLLMRSEADIANLIMQAAIWRRVGVIQQSSAGIILIGDLNDVGTIQLRRFLIRNGYPHRFMEPGFEQMEEGSDSDTSPPRDSLPAILFADGRVLHKPTIPSLADELGISELLDPENIFDLAIVGAGPAGLAAAVYGASEGLCTLVLEGLAPGGQAGTSSKIENYLGFPTGVSGWELANRAQVQAQKFGARLAIARSVVGLEHSDDFLRIRLTGGSTVRAHSVVIASGAQYRKLDIPNYARFENQGILYAATGMEAALCRNQEVAIIGGGNSAGQAAVFMGGVAKHVHLIIRGASLTDTMSQYLISRIENSPRITLHTHTVVERLDGENFLETMTWKNNETGERATHHIGSMFVLIGADPNTSWLGTSVELDPKGFVVTGSQTSFENSRYATNIPGVYAIGDVRSDSVKRVASAVGEGSVVISDVHRYLAAHRGRSSRVEDLVRNSTEQPLS